MAFWQGIVNELKPILRPGDFAVLGIHADYVGKDTIKISRNGKRLGSIKKSIGKFVLYSSDTGQPQLCAFTREKLLTGLAQYTPVR